jgi:hypothetical protein
MCHMFVSWIFWKVNTRIWVLSWSGTYIRTCHPKWMSSTQLSRITSSIHGKHHGYLWFSFLLIHTSTKHPLNLNFFWLRYQCKYAPNDYHGDPNHSHSIKWGYLALFCIKRLFTLLDVVEIMFYYKYHTKIDGS